MGIRKAKTTTLLRMGLRAISNLVFIARGWRLDQVYRDMGNWGPEDDESFVITILDEARDVWKPQMDTQDDEGVPPTERETETRRG